MSTDRTLPLHTDPWFTFRFADDRIVPRFHLEGVAPGVDFVIDGGRGDTLRLCRREARRIGPVRQNKNDLRRIVRALRRGDQRGHVGAAPGDQDRGAASVRVHSANSPR